MQALIWLCVAVVAVVAVLEWSTVDWLGRGTLLGAIVLMVLAAEVERLCGGR